MRVEVWRGYLYGTYDKQCYAQLFPELAERILHGIEFGVSVEFEGDRDTVRFSENHRVTPQDKQKIADVIAADIAILKKSGPHARLPFLSGHPLWVSPIGAVPKKYSEKIRVIHDLSFPKGGDSVNAGIADGSTDISSFGDAALMVRKAGRSCWLIKLDVEAAYKQVPVRKEDWHLLGFYFEGKYYYERVLPFGLRSSCKLWELFATALHWLCERVLECEIPFYVIHYVDDFLFVVEPGEGSEAFAQNLLDRALKLCAILGVPMAEAKVEGPTHCLIFLGIEINTVEMTARLPDIRLAILKPLISGWKSYTHARLSDVQSLVGLLQHACCVVPPGRFFKQRLISAMTTWEALQRAGTVGPYAPMPISENIKRDILWWDEFLSEWNGISLLLEQEWELADKLSIFTDACTTGYGAYFKGRWVAGAWRPQDLVCAQRSTGVSMPFLELRALVIAANAWGHLWKGKKIIFRSDCMPVVQAITKGYSSRPSQMHQLRTLIILAMRHNFDFKCIHIPGITNITADVLSRFGDSPQFRAVRPNAAPSCSPFTHPSLPRASESDMKRTEEE